MIKATLFFVMAIVAFLFFWNSFPVIAERYPLLFQAVNMLFVGFFAIESYDLSNQIKAARSRRGA